VAVSDDGTGPGEDHGPVGHGWQTMRERAEELRGTLSIRQGHGTTVLAELPIPAGSVLRPAVPARR
jgi:signal transduction histidine kinase